MKVKGLDGAVFVKVVDSNGRWEKTLTLSKDSFKHKFKGGSGEIEENKLKWVDWESEDANRFKIIKWASEYFMGIRPYNANKRIEQIEILDDTQNEWRTMERRIDNASIIQPINEQLISFPYKLRLITADGSIVEYELNEFTAGTAYEGTQQFLIDKNLD